MATLQKERRVILEELDGLVSRRQKCAWTWMFATCIDTDLVVVVLTIALPFHSILLSIKAEGGAANLVCG